MDSVFLPISNVVRDLHIRATCRTERPESEIGGDAMKAVCVGLLLCASTISHGAGQPDRLTLRVSPAVAFAPANMVVRASIAADADNRTIEIIAESDTFYRSSQVPLDGDRAPRTSLFEFRSLPPGIYEVKGILRGSAGHERAMVRQSINVIATRTGH